MLTAYGWVVAESLTIEKSQSWVQLLFRYNIESVREYKIVYNINGDTIRGYFASDNSEENKRDAYKRYYEIEEEIMRKVGA